MVWGGISLDGATDMYVIWNWKLRAQQHQDEIRHPIARPYTGVKCHGFLLMDDNARPRLNCE